MCCGSDGVCVCVVFLTGCVCVVVLTGCVCVVVLTGCVLLVCRWNSRSEHLQRKVFRANSHTGSLDELEEFAHTFHQRGRRRDYELELQEREHTPPFRDGPPEAWLEHQQSDHYRKERERERDRERERERDRERSRPPPSPRKRRDTGDSERAAPPRNGRGGPAYDDAFLNTVLERKARGRGGRGGEEDSFHSDTPSKASSKKSSDCYLSRSPSNRPEEEDSLPPYCEMEAERYRAAEPVPRPFSYTRPNLGVSHTLPEHRDEREKPRKVVSYL